MDSRSPEPGPSRTRLNGVSDLFAASLLLALGIAYVELLAGCQRPYWTGGTRSDWLGALLALGLYTGATCALATLLALALRIVRVQRRGTLMDHLCALAAAAVVWHWLWSPESPQAFALELAFCSAVLLISVAKAILLALKWTSTGGCHAILAAAMLSGCIAAHEGIRLVAFTPNASRAAAKFSVIWLLATVAAAVVLCGLAKRMRVGPRARTVSIVSLCLLAPFFVRLAPVAPGLKATPTQPSVIFVTADSLRADYCSTYGGKAPTPSLQALADEGVLFENHYALAPWTVPSLAALFAGRYPPGLTPDASYEQRKKEEVSYHRLGAYWLGPDSQTLAGRLKAAGYRTCAIVANPTMAAHTWLSGEFDTFLVVNSEAESRKPQASQTPLLAHRFPALAAAFTPAAPPDSTDLLVWYTKRFLEKHRAGNVFLWVHFMDPHSPYGPPAEYIPDPLPISQFPPPAHARANPDSEGGGYTPELKDCAKALYAGEVHYVDTALGEIVAAARALGYGDRTYFAFSSDHGEEFWEHGWHGHGQTLHNELIRVPLALAGPGIAPHTISRPVSAIDMMPTFAGLLDVPASEDAHGIDLSPILRGEKEDMAQPPVFAQGTYMMTSPTREVQQAVVLRHRKFMRGLRDRNREVYDLEADPQETADLAESQPDEANKLEALVDEWGRTFPVSFSDVEQDLLATSDPDEEQKVEETLRALGYLE